ncbi:MAG: MarR family transcriptional regulator [Thermoplasmata archaeon]
MVVIFGTIGYEPKSIKPTLTGHANVEKLVLFYTSKNEEVMNAVNEVHNYCKKMNLPYEDVRLDDPYDLVATALRMKKALYAHKGKDIIFNVTGSTKVISAAAIIVCIIDNIPAVYVNERTSKEEPLPLLNVKSKNIVTKKQLEILKIIMDNGGSIRPVELSKKLGVKPASISLQLKNMARRGLITIERDPDNMRSNIVRNSAHVPLLLYSEGKE